MTSTSSDGDVDDDDDDGNCQQRHNSLLSGVLWTDD